MFDPSKLDLEVNEKKQSQSQTPSTENTVDSDTLMEKHDPLAEISQKEEETQQNIYLHDEKALALEEKTKQVQQEAMPSDAIIFDINISSIQDVLDILIKQNYDFATFDASDRSVAISFKKDKVEKEVKHIKFPTYSAIIIKAKTLCKLSVEESKNTQEGSGDIQIKNIAYKILVKTLPGGYAEKLFLKVKSTEKKIQKKENKKVGLGKILGFFTAAIFAILVIGGGFLAFVLFSANNVADLTFFNNLGVNVDSIRDFTAKLVDFVFFTLLFIEFILLFIFLVKAILTKKEFKQKKITHIVMSVFLLLVTMSTGFLWLTLSKKINSLHSQDYGKILFYDNDKYLSKVFDENGSKVNVADNLIGPVKLRFDITEFMKQVIDSSFTPKTLTWVIGEVRIEKPIQDYELIHEFKTQGIQNVVIEINGTDISGKNETITQDVATINISHLIDITEKKQKSGGSVFDFNAQSLENLGEVKWYYIPNLKDKTDSEQKKVIAKALEKEITKGYRFTSKIIFDEEVIVALQLMSKQDTDESLDKIFIIKKQNSDTIEGEIGFERNKLKDLEFEFFIKNADTEFGDGVIETFDWEIDGKQYANQADLGELEDSSKIKHTFSHYGDFEVKVTITDSRGKTKVLTQSMEIPKVLQLKSGLIITQNNLEIDDMKYDATVNEYIISDVGVPTQIKLDSRSMAPDNKLYTLDSVSWDYDSDGNFDETNRVGNYDLDTQGSHSIVAKFIYKHRILKNKNIEVEQRIYIDGIKKEANVHFEINKQSSYTPVIVGFDASKSEIKDGNIQKFIWDYGDGFTEEKDAIVKGHKYIKPGDYDVSLTIVGEDGKTFKKTKKLILKPKPQTVKLKTSLKTAPVGQWIDFSSDDSQGQIDSYLWKFGDGETSPEANPSYSYKKPGVYDVELIVEFNNRNVESDSVQIEIINK